MEQLLRETLLASGTALLGIFLLPLALVRGPAEVAEPPQTPAADTALEQTEEANRLPRHMTGSGRCGYWRAIPSGR